MNRPGTVRVSARVSRETEESTSVERQVKGACDEAERRWPGVPIVVYEDSGVSGGLHPTEREGFGRLVADWQRGDVLMFWKIDRIARSLIGFVDVVRLADDAGVTLVCLQDPFDLSNPAGRMQANILATFAEFERETIRARVRAARRHMHKVGRWTGGRPPYGLTAASNPAGPGKVLVRDEVAAGVIRRIFEMLVGDPPMSITGIAARLQAEGIPSPRVHNSGRDAPQPAAWSAQSIQTLITSPTIIGHQIDPMTRRRVRANGLPVEVWPPVLTEGEQQRAIAALPVNSGRGPRASAHWLYRVAKCGPCGGNLKRGNASRLVCNGQRHSPHPSLTVAAPELEDYVNKTVRNALGGAFETTREFAPGVDTSGDLSRLREFLSELEEDRRAGMYGSAEGLERFRRQYADTLESIAELEAAPAEPAGWMVRRTGRRFAERWDEMSDAQRGEWLRDAGVAVSVLARPVARIRVPVEGRVRIDWGEASDMYMELEALRDEHTE